MNIYIQLFIAICLVILNIFIFIVINHSFENKLRMKILKTLEEAKKMLQKKRTQS